jgi:uncharacterized glyoxalase superfamily protein PhnB
LTSTSIPSHSLNVGIAAGKGERIYGPRCGRIHVPTRQGVDDVFRDMTGAGYRGLQEPHDAIWGARYAIIEDPDGIAVGVMSPVSPEKRSPPPDV